MPPRWNDLQWNGRPGHYEVYYLTFTEPASEVGFWIRYTMVAPLAETGERATCSLWFCAMDRRNPGANLGRKVSFPVSELTAGRTPFRLSIDSAWLSDEGMAGSIEGGGERVAWDLEWRPRLAAYGHVHPILRAARIAKTILFLPHPDLELSGTVELPGRRIDVQGARGAQAHLWGSKHASRWAWAHCNDFTGHTDAFIDGVSVFVPRFGRELGPNTPVVGRIAGRNLNSINPVAVRTNRSDFGPTSWRFEAREHGLRVAGTVGARREDLVGVTYHDPDGELAYCYNTEVADMRLEVFERARRRGEWTKTGELHSEGRAHFEYAQREPIEGVELKIS